MTVVESSATSASISIFSMLAFYLWKRWNNKQRVRGCLLLKGKTYAEKHFTTNEKVLYFDMDGAISVEPITKIPMNERRLNFYPKAQEKLKELKKHYKNMLIVVCSSDFELLCYLGLKHKSVAFLPEPKFYEDNKDKFNDEMLKLKNDALTMEIKVPKKYQVHYDSFDSFSRKIVKVYNEMVKK
jgi:uncharacterized protein YdhG (YjbR/CyaY superfamily)